VAGWCVVLPSARSLHTQHIQSSMLKLKVRYSKHTELNKANTGMCNESLNYQQTESGLWQVRRSYWDCCWPQLEFLIEADIILKYALLENMD